MACFLAFVYWLSKNLSPTPAGPACEVRLLAHTETSGIYLTTAVAPFHTIKVSKYPAVAQREYRIHRAIELAFLTVAEEFGDYGVELDLPGIPKYFAFSQGHKQSPLKGYFTEILPYYESEDEHFLVKIYMGNLKPLSYGSITGFYNRPAYPDYLYFEHIDFQVLSATMGTTLAMLHWRCGVDAAGVKFVFERESRGSTKLWLMDFSNCKMFELASQDAMMQLVDAILDNEPYWPKCINLPGLMNTWITFRTAYLKMSNLLLKDVSSDSRLRLLPLLFMDELERIQGS
ncbi:hypothetical protein EDB81DRAFT_766879 [Dactylonectria macrodidyma]|uniref:DUF3669 domain-containing protein n=1 Tax=Dactylonectria macrodidyma TaxID=307937 RepID=A0A9P9IEW9_9HYPO|nr:hypothetical protein EDB81DRAFT_766879 [Dactylonectria macrodidyma]